MLHKSISTQTLQRLPMYLNYLKALSKEEFVNISATIIADALNLNDVQVRKDLALISTGGRPKIGYVTENLIFDIESFLGFDNADSAVIAGAGVLGRAILSYDGFKRYGLNIVAAFDTNDEIIGTSVNDKRVLASDKLSDICKRLRVKIGIIAVPPEEAQEVCNEMVESGILAIWNFAPIHLKVPDYVLVQNEDMAFSLAKLSQRINQKNLCQLVSTYI